MVKFVILCHEVAAGGFENLSPLDSSPSTDRDLGESTSYRGRSDCTALNREHGMESWKNTCALRVRLLLTILRVLFEGYQFPAQILYLQEKKTNNGHV